MSGLFGFITWEVFWNQGVIPAGFLLGLIAIYQISDKCMDWVWLRLLELNVYLKKRLKKLYGRH